MSEASSKRNFVYYKIKTAIEGNILKVGDKVPSESELMKKYNITRYSARKVLGDLEDEKLIIKFQGKGCYVNNTLQLSDQPRTVQTDSSSKLKCKKSFITNSKQILLLSTRADSFYFVKCVNGIEDALAGSPYSLTIKLSNYDAITEENYLRDALDGSYCGILLFPAVGSSIYINRYLYKLIENKHIPCITIGSIIPFSSIPYVKANDYMGGIIAAKYLIDKGHTNIACLMNIDEYCSCMRYAGFLDGAFHNAKKEYQVTPIMFHNYNKKTFFIDPNSTSSILEAASKVSAFFCYNDQTAVYLYNLLIQSHYSIPEDISIIGFDDSYLCETTEVSLSTISQNPKEIGYLAGQSIQRLINGDSTMEDCSKMFTPHLIDRESVKQIKP